MCIRDRDRTKPITARKLGGDFDRTAVLAVLEQNAQRGVTVRYTCLLYTSTEMIQTDNGSEFNYTQKTKRTHPLDILCDRLHIAHKTIRPATPWHNGKVERSHRNDQERFYNHLKFYSYADLQLQMKRYLGRSNRIPMSVLGWKTPKQKREELEAARFC